MKLQHEMTYSKKDIFLKHLKMFYRHPYFGIFVSAFALFMIQILGISGFIRPSTINLLTPVIIFYIVALGFALLLGYAGLASLGTAGFVGLNSYVIAIFVGRLGISTEIALMTGIAISIALGVVVGFISLRIEGMYLAIITLGISEILVEIFIRWTEFTRGMAGITISRITFLGMTFRLADRFFFSYYIIIFFMALTMVFMINLINSPTGRAMLAMKNSTSAAQAMGISLLKFRLLAFVLATVVAGLGGSLYFIRNLSTNPTTWGIALSLNILAAVVIGGMKSIYGVMAGTFIVFGLNELVLKRMSFFSQYTSAYLIINGLLIILVVMFYPGGIVRLFSDIKKLIIRAYKHIMSKIKEYRYGSD